MENRLVLIFQDKIKEKGYEKNNWKRMVVSMVIIMAYSKSLGRFWMEFSCPVDLFSVIDLTVGCCFGTSRILKVNSGLKCK